MPIVVTGAGGFVGRVIVERLLAAGRQVVATDTDLSRLPDDPKLRLVPGDIAEPAGRHGLFVDGCDGLIHLATVPGGAAEQDPALARRVNVDATLDLIEAAARSRSGVRVVHASSIAVFGDRLPPAGVDDATPLAPRLLYAGHKAMIEVAIATYSHRGAVDGISLRLPAILARPRARSGMLSAFMSDVFHALRAREPFVCPVSPEATIWAQSVSQCAANLVHALEADLGASPPGRAVTLPALRIRFADLVGEICRATRSDPALVSYEPNAQLEAGFGKQPPLATAAADALGFRHDGSPDRLVERALAHIAASEAAARPAG